MEAFTLNFAAIDFKYTVYSDDLTGIPSNILYNVPHGGIAGALQRIAFKAERQSAVVHCFQSRFHASGLSRPTAICSSRRRAAAPR